MSVTNQPDINNLELMNEVVEVDGSVDSEQFFQPPLPDDGVHDAIIKLGNRGLKIERQKDKQTKNRTGPAFINAHFAIQLLNDNGEPGIMCFDNPTSIVMQSSGTSRLHAILDILGDPAPPRCTFGELIEHTERALAQDARCQVVTQWEAQIEDPPGTYRDVKKGQKNFPQLVDEHGQPNGKFDPEILDPKTGQKVRAVARVVRFLRLPSARSVSVA